jgi:hypothetical protein
MAVRKANRRFAWRAPSFVRLGLTSLMLMAFALQSTITQTHIHIGSFSTTAGFSTDLKVADQPTKSNHTRVPVDGDPANCPICQEMMYAGQFVMPAAMVFILPAQVVSIVPPSVEIPRVVRTISHSWQGRAPPRI